MILSLDKLRYSHQLLELIICETLIHKTEVPKKKKKELFSPLEKKNIEIKIYTSVFSSLSNAMLKNSNGLNLLTEQFNATIDIFGTNFVSLQKFE